MTSNKMPSYKIKQKKLQDQQQQDQATQISNLKTFMNGITNTQEMQFKTMNQISNLLDRQQQEIKERDQTIQHLADQILNLQEQVALLHKAQKESIIVMEKKMDTRKCIELTTNMGRTYQQQIDIHQDKIQSATSHLSHLDNLQKENLTLIDNKMETEKCIELTNNIEKTCQTRMNNHENIIKKSIHDLKTKKDQYFPTTHDKKRNHKTHEIKRTRQNYNKNSLNNRSILIANIKLKENSNLVTQHFFNDFQIPQICLQRILTTSWTQRGKLRMVYDSPRSANWMRTLISQQLEKKLSQGGFVGFGFQRFFIIHKWNVGLEGPPWDDQYIRRLKLKNNDDYIKQEKSSLTDQMKSHIEKT
jgi:hypothetical protein